MDLKREHLWFLKGVWCIYMNKVFGRIFYILIIFGSISLFILNEGHFLMEQYSMYSIDNREDYD